MMSRNQKNKTNMLFEQKIFYKIFIASMLMVSLVVAIIGFFVLKEQGKAILEVMRTQALSVAKSIELAIPDAIVNDDQSFIVQYGLKVLEQSPSLEYIIISEKTKKPLLIQKKSWRVLEKLPTEAQKFELSVEQNTIIDNVFGRNEKNYYFVYPLNFGGLEWGWAHLGFSLNTLNDAYSAMYYKIAIIFTSVFICIGFLIYFAVGYMVRPLLLLNHATKKITQGNLNIKLASNRRDEIGELTYNFNLMVHSLAEAQEKLINSNAILEEKVMARTQELEEINQTLDIRVHLEMAKMREQKQILIHQSRFAAMGEMIANIAHQWRQPLNALSLLLQNITIAYERGQLDEELIRRVNDKGLLLTSTMSATIDDFRNFFKPNRDKELFQVSVQIDKVWVMLQATLRANLIEVHTHIHNDFQIYGFPNEFSQVLLNIINNAKDALVEKKIEKPTIQIETYCKESMVYLTIADNAGGIDEAIMGKIFDPYFTTKEEGKGMGIGLYMSKVIIETNMDGKLSVLNDAKGAVFIVSFKEIPK